MSSYRPDPGGIFASDTHRRVLGHLPLPDADALALQGPGGPKAHRHSLGHRISGDAHHELQTVEDLEAVLHELEADGLASQLKSGWRMTKAGLDALNAPLPQEPAGPASPALLQGLEVV
jgi:hypothetical protein